MISVKIDKNDRSNSTVIKSTRGTLIIVDTYLYDELSQYDWKIRKQYHARYAFREGPVRGKKFYILMHRQIMRPLPHQVVHHANGNGLDNRIENLMVLTVEQHNKLHGRKGCGCGELRKTQNLSEKNAGTTSGKNKITPSSVVI